MNSATIHRQQVDRLTSAFFRAFRPPTVFENTVDFINMAHAAINNPAKSQADRYAEAARLLVCVPAIRDAMSVDALNFILSRDFTLPPAPAD